MQWGWGDWKGQQGEGDEEKANREGETGRRVTGRGKWGGEGGNGDGETGRVRRGGVMGRREGERASGRMEVR